MARGEYVPITVSRRIGAPANEIFRLCAVHLETQPSKQRSSRAAQVGDIPGSVRVAGHQVEPLLAQQTTDGAAADPDSSEGQ
jgi:hypothetical protein